MRISLRTVLLWLEALGAIGAALAAWYLGYAIDHPSITRAPHHDHRTAALSVVAAVAVLSAASRPLYALSAGRLIARQDRVKTAMRGLLWTVRDTCEGMGQDVPVRDLGASAWIVRGWGGMEWLHRLDRERFRESPQASGIRWTKGKGVVGRCWQDEREVVVELERIDQAHGGCTPDQWQKVRADTRMKMSHAEFKKVTGKYGTVIAVPVKDRTEHVIGVVTLDGPPGFHATLSRPLVVTDVTAAAQLVAQLLGRA